MKYQAKIDVYKKAILVANLKKQEIIKNAKISNVTLQRVERGLPVSAITANKIAHALKVEVTDLFA